MTKVLLTGFTGFLASQILPLLLKKGFVVVGTLRNSAKAEPILKRHSNYSAQIFLEEVKDIAAPGAYDGVFEKHPDITQVLHLASPYTVDFDAKDAQSAMYGPAVDGTVGILKAVHKYGQGKITKVVITSSYAAQLQALPDKYPGAPTITEETWNPNTPESAGSNNFMIYCVSKKLAEKAAWDFVKNTKPQFTITTICVPFVYGADVQPNPKQALSTTLLPILPYIDSKKSGKVKVDYSQSSFFVYRKDAAQAHLNALLYAQDINTRWVISAGQFSVGRVLTLAKKGLPKQYADRIADIEENEADYENMPGLDNSKSKAESRLHDYVSLETAAVESVKFVIDSIDAFPESYRD